MAKRTRKRARILVVTPEIASLPPGMPRSIPNVVAKAGGMADVTAAIVTSLFEMGADVHVALPNYRKVFDSHADHDRDRPLREYKAHLPGKRIHFAEDSVFYYRPAVYSGDVAKMAMRFQREVVNNIIRTVKPDLVHAHDWTTGLIPGMARRLGIPSLFTVHNIHTHEATLDEIEDAGIPVRDFWTHLYFNTQPLDYESSRAHNRVNLLVSGIFSAHYVNTVSPTFLAEIVDGKHAFVPDSVRQELANKAEAGCAFGIINAPPTHYNPRTDESLVANYDSATHATARAQNKAAFQKRVGLPQIPDAPLFFWPSRLDPVQKGCDLLAALMPELRTYSDGAQLAVVADGPFSAEVARVIAGARLRGRAVIVPFNEGTSRLGFGGSDFTLMPSLFEPCGLPQMIGSKYGSLPVAHDTGGLHDTVEHVAYDEEGLPSSGNGFVFKHHDVEGLRWAIGEARTFYALDPRIRDAHIGSVMEGARRFSHEEAARAYFRLYEQMLERPLVKDESG